MVGQRLRHVKVALFDACCQIAGEVNRLPASYKAAQGDRCRRGYQAGVGCQLAAYGRAGMTGGKLTVDGELVGADGADVDRCRQRPHAAAANGCRRRRLIRRRRNAPAPADRRCQLSTSTVGRTPVRLTVGSVAATGKVGTRRGKAAMGEGARRASGRGRGRCRQVSASMSVVGG